MNKLNYNIYVFTTKYVLKKGSPILRVLHNKDGDWQFLGDEGNLQEADAMIVSLGEIIEFDTTLSEIISLPVGKQALRSNKGETWYIYDI
jgi:hypothetical protein